MGRGVAYSNGKVGMFGVSYDGATQMLTAIAHPPHLIGICPGLTPSNYHDGWVYQGGAFEQWFDEAWTTGLSANVLARSVAKAPGVPKGLMQLPLARYRVFDLDPQSSDLTGLLAPHFRDWLSHPNYDQYWKRWSIEDYYPDIVVPALTIAAWYDLFQGGSLRNYIGTKQHAGTEIARKNQRLIVIIGGHAGTGQKIGDIDFGAEAARLDDSDLTGWSWYYDLVLQWYDYLLKGARTKLIREKPVTIFVMGTNRWREEDDWPLKRVRTAKYYLHSDGHAKSLNGTGSLSTAIPASEKR